MNKSQLLSWGKSAVGWPLSIISIVFILKLVYDQSSQINLNFGDINLFYLSLGVFFFFLYFLMRSFLWQLELSEKGYKINFRENIYRFSFSELKRYTPGNIWSFLSRASQFSELGVDKKTIGVSILADIQLVIIGCGIISLLSIPWIMNSPDDLRLNLSNLLPLSLFGIAIFSAATGLVYTKRYSTSILRRNRVDVLLNFFLPGFAIGSKFKLSAISILTYFIFGVGNFFILLSISNIGFSYFLSLTSFFVFSLLVGYLSFITPMGLGVRELIVTLGLSSVMSTADAGAVAIFSRIILIISELLFLLLILIWKKSLWKKSKN